MKLKCLNMKLNGGINFVLFSLCLAAFALPSAYGQNTNEMKSSESLQKAIDLLENTESEIARLQGLTENLQAEIEGSRKGLEALEKLRTAQAETFAKQSALLQASNRSLKRWKTAALWGVPAALVAGLLSGILIK